MAGRTQTSEQVPPGPYRVNIGINYPPGRRAEAGDVVNDLPPESLAWLLADGVIEPVAGLVAENEEGEEGEVDA